MNKTLIINQNFIKMKIFKFIIIALFMCISNFLSGQNEATDTTKVLQLNEVMVTANRMPVVLKNNPGAISVVTPEQINAMTKSIATDEILRLVPGVKVDNGTDGSRVHLYIRGHGVLSESGFRGIGVYIDGISVNDPGGYCPDLYDVDWQTVKKVEVVKGLSTSMYGGGATGGVINITTKDGGTKPVNETFYGSVGSYGFWKTMEQVDGTQGDVNYRISYSHMQGNGYRAHQAFMGDNFSEKLKWTPSSKIKITQLLTYTRYFNQNSEGINLARIEGDIIGLQANNVGWRASNNDAVPYNEFHLTQRLTGATIVDYNIDDKQNITFKGFFRMNNYRETSNNGDDHKPYINQGITTQYNFNSGKENLKNHFSLGADFSSQVMDEHEFAVPGEFERDSNRVDSHFSLQSFDLDSTLINQNIQQRNLGVFLIDKIDIRKKLFATVNVRYDYVYNELTNNRPVPDSLSFSGSRSFQKPTYRLGLSYDACKYANIYANWGTGFLVPTSDELYNNPDYWGGFNTTIQPAESQGEEMGVRGSIEKFFYYDVTGFSEVTKNGFYRYSLPGRGNNTAFFGNIGENKYGIETFVSYSPVKPIIIDVAYTYSHFVYPAHDSITSDHWIPQCPQHMLTAEVSFKLSKNFILTLNTEYESKWKLQVDDSIYDYYTIGATYYQPSSVRSSWVTAPGHNYGYNIYSADLRYRWKLGSLNGEISLFVKNIFDQHYFGFTEPNNAPDYNSYQPAPGREIFGSVRIRF